MLSASTLSQEAITVSLVVTKDTDKLAFVFPRQPQVITCCPCSGQGILLQEVQYQTEWVSQVQSVPLFQECWLLLWEQSCHFLCLNFLCFD